jgi:hypothetical protein
MRKSARKHHPIPPCPKWLPRDPAMNPWIQQNMQRITAGEENADNERVAELGNEEDEARYEQAIANGCCGFTDVIVTHRATGRRFRFGFNYGH